MPLSRPLPGAETPFGPTAPAAEHVPPSWFLTTMTVYSAREVAGLLHPATDRGFAAFPDARGPIPSAPRGSGHRSPEPFPATRFTPSEDFPRRQPYRITAAVALLPLPSLSGPGTWPKPVPDFGSRGAEATRGLALPALRGAWLATGQRRIVRYDDAPIRRSGPPRHRARAASAAPKRRVGNSR
jgi:hypothetical protein